MPTLLTPEQLQARSRRSLWIALGLVGFIVLIFLTTFLRMQSNLEERKAMNAAATAEAAR
jgi:type II secretory pathway pseudopilin PulG